MIENQVKATARTQIMLGFVGHGKDSGFYLSETGRKSLVHREEGIIEDMIS